VIIIYVIITPLHPKFISRFRLQAESKIDTVMKQTLSSTSLSLPRSTADANHNHFIMEEDSFTVQLTFSDGNCSSSIYLLAVHLFCFQNTKFLFTNYMHTCLLIILFFMTFGHIKLVRQQKCNY